MTCITVTHSTGEEITMSLVCHRAEGDQTVLHGWYKGKPYDKTVDLPRGEVIRHIRASLEDNRRNSHSQRDVILTDGVVELIWDEIEAPARQAAPTARLYVFAPRP